MLQFIRAAKLQLWREGLQDRKVEGDVLGDVLVDGNGDSAPRVCSVKRCVEEREPLSGFI